MALLMKYYENVELISNIKLHSIWHILGAHMFKEMIILFLFLATSILIIQAYITYLILKI